MIEQFLPCLTAVSEELGLGSLDSGSRDRFAPSGTSLGLENILGSTLFRNHSHSVCCKSCQHQQQQQGDREREPTCRRDCNNDCVGDIMNTSLQVVGTVDESDNFRTFVNQRQHQQQSQQQQQEKGWTIDLAKVLAKVKCHAGGGPPVTAGNNKSSKLKESSWINGNAQDFDDGSTSMSVLEPDSLAEADADDAAAVQCLIDVDNINGVIHAANEDIQPSKTTTTTILQSMSMLPTPLSSSARRRSWSSPVQLDSNIVSRGYLVKTLDNDTINTDTPTATTDPIPITNPDSSYTWNSIQNSAVTLGSPKNNAMFTKYNPTTNSSSSSSSQNSTRSRPSLLQSLSTSCTTNNNTLLNLFPSSKSTGTGSTGTGGRRRSCSASSTTSSLATILGGSVSSSAAKLGGVSGNNISNAISRDCSNFDLLALEEDEVRREVELAAGFGDVGGGVLLKKGRGVLGT
ncbi:hypothetical protein HDU76_009393 [Blyttiomyces sp. JEL0837]|nr:hypothetical protein HDU76_009393 [Blyttiomyces sp. JEL0837]